MCQLQKYNVAIDQHVLCDNEEALWRDSRSSKDEQEEKAQQAKSVV